MGGGCSAYLTRRKIRCQICQMISILYTFIKQVFRISNGRLGQKTVKLTGRCPRSPSKTFRLPGDPPGKNITPKFVECCNSKIAKTWNVYMESTQTSNRYTSNWKKTTTVWTFSISAILGFLRHSSLMSPQGQFHSLQLPWGFRKHTNLKPGGEKAGFGNGWDIDLPLWAVDCVKPHF